MNYALRPEQSDQALAETPDRQSPERAAARSPGELLEMIRSIGHPDLRDYCIEQIKGARCAEDMAAVVELVFEVTRKRG